MSSGELIPGDPAALAVEANERLFYAPDDWTDGTTEEVNQTLEFLGTMARSLDFTDRSYRVRANRALTIPESAIGGKVYGEVTYGDLYNVSFRGVFSQYARVQIGRIIGAGSVRAYCLHFNDIVFTASDNSNEDASGGITFVPADARVPEGRLFFVPALAINTIDSLPRDC